MDPLIMSQLACVYEQEKLDNAARHRDDEPIWHPLRKAFASLKRIISTTITRQKQVTAAPQQQPIENC